MDYDKCKDIRTLPEAHYAPTHTRADLPSFFFKYDFYYNIVYKGAKDKILWLILFHALRCCVFKIVVLYVKGRFMLYCSQARMRLRSPFCNYSVEAFYNDVHECVGMKNFRKTREIHSFSMTFSSDAFLCWVGYFHKRCILTPEVILSYSKHALGLCFITSYTMIRPESDEHISGCGLLSVSCPIAQGTILWYSTIFTNRTYPEMQP